ncbi:NADH-quinone oxidoreductase subunit NuoG [Candidatus Synchoanobacter obligatus]|uniref:NADH-quinone oxidoreductase subunit G n=1 Tax=Candidatus Synchoanobacter obligatus TaxID=2919597 RepID=A0ABT1L457_9GAMM|nr:NADH-quinone oxidoreductase subunit NuoG [Candidatus Synchoanobacter obligatus]MCP8351967.1 NADH-quinone oxidoreductase subunit NuoG [Candidatus Synchoanobacter obligatus]
MSHSIELTINERVIVAKPGERLIDVAQREGIYIPRFCYHPKLSVVASCRMCLVDIEGIGKTQPACATLVSDNMVVKTQSHKAIDAQKAIMQFLLINHPLHCPICDQGGECELQDTAMGYGKGVSEYSESKRVVADEDLGPLVKTDMSLCIHCTRCVRFGKEVAGVPELSFIGRGDTAGISTYLSRGLKSELSGNVIDLCPVGALTSKPFRFKGRSWGFKQQRGVSSHDCIGSNLVYHTMAKGYENITDVMRVVPYTNMALNEGWLADRDRFSYEGLYASERLETPLLKEGDHWRQASFEEVLTLIYNRMVAVDPEKVGVWLSSQMTLEEGYLAQHVFRSSGVENIDHRLWMNADVPLYQRPSSVALGDLHSFDTIVLIGSNIRYEQPILALRLKEASEKGSDIISIGAIAHEYYFPYQCHLTQPQELAMRVFELLHPPVSGQGSLSGKVLFLLGEEALIHVDIAQIQAMVHHWCDQSESEYMLLTPGPNSLGLAASGCTPDYKAWGAAKANGLSYYRMLRNTMDVMWLHQVDPMQDVSDPKRAYQLLKSAFTIAVSAYDTASLRDCADVILPLALAPETPGSYLNYQGLQQKFVAASSPRGEAKMGWSIYHVLGSMLSKVVAKDYDTLSQDVDRAYGTMVWPDIEQVPVEKPKVISAQWMRVGLSSWVRGDGLVRHAAALQQAYPIEEFVLLAETQEASIEGQITNLKYSDTIAPGTLVYERGQVFYAETMGPLDDGDVS